MKVSLLVYVLILAFICLQSPALAQNTTWQWKDIPANDSWSNAANWDQGTVTATAAPSTTSDVIINLCTVCPKLSADIAIKSLTVNSGAVLRLETFTVTISGYSQFRYATIYSNDGKIVSFDIKQVQGNTFIGRITLVRSGGPTNNWSGGNVFNGPTTITNDTPYRAQPWSDGTYLRTATSIGDTFHETITFNNFGWALNAVFGNGNSIFHKRAEFNNRTNSYYPSYFLANGGSGNIICYGEVVANNPSASPLMFSRGDKIVFKGSVAINNPHPGSEVTYYTYGNSIQVGGTSGQTSTFEGPVTVTNTSQRSATYQLVNVEFNYGGRCVFKSAFAIGTPGFRRGNLILKNCIFENTSQTTLNLSSGLTPETYSGILTIASGTIFNGVLQATAPHILLNGAIFKEEATFTKKASGANNSLGGNIFRKKLTIHNQAGGSSPMNLATQTNDLIQQ